MIATVHPTWFEISLSLLSSTISKVIPVDKKFCSAARFKDVIISFTSLLVVVTSLNSNPKFNVASFNTSFKPSSKAVCKGIGGGLCIYVEPEIKGGGKSFSGKMYYPKGGINQKTGNPRTQAEATTFDISDEEGMKNFFRAIMGHTDDPTKNTKMNNMFLYLYDEYKNKKNK